MAKPPEFRRVLREDIPDAPNWVDPIITNYNLFLEQSYSLFNSNLTVGDNVTGRIYQTTFTTPSDYATGGFNSFQFAWSFFKNPEVVVVGKIEKVAGGIITDPVTVTSWSQPSANSVKISYISGLAASTKYNIRLLAM